MTFFLSKFLWQLFNPFNLFLIIILIAVLLRFFSFRKISNFLFFILFFLFLITGVLPTGSYLNYLLEKDYHYSNIPENIDGILILSGATNPLLSKEHDQVNLNSSAERLTESVHLIKKYPNAKIVFSGGSGSLINPDLSHATVANKFYLNMGLDTSNFIFEKTSRNTYENIIFSKKIVNPQKNEKWIVITSAFHMKRSIGIAEKADWNLIPYPTDFYKLKNFSWNLSFNFLENLYEFKKASHEWLGLISYYFMNRTSKVF